MAYTKLFNEILASTIWDEEMYVKVVWITLLAMRNERNEVMASVPGLAHMARVSLEQCKKAIEKFSSPDPFSRSKEHEGKRIQAIDGGWFLLNGEKYRRKQTEDERREYQAQWVRNKRNSLKNYHNVDSALTNVDKIDNVDVVEQSRVKQSRVEKSNKNNTPTSNDPDVLEIFDAFRDSWGRSKQYELTHQRKTWIKAALRSYDKPSCLRAIEMFRNDPFDRRAEFNDIKYLFGKQDRIDKWCGQNLAPRSVVLDKAQKKHQESKDRIEIVNRMIDMEDQIP